MSRRQTCRRSLPTRSAATTLRLASSARGFRKRKSASSWPPEVSAAGYWGAMVEAEEAQTNELRSDERSDYWAGLSALFKQDPHRHDDPDGDVLSRFLNEDSTVIDVGAGAGRVALPLALKCREVVAVEPSAAMCKDLRELASEYDIANVEVVESTWEEASIE